MLTESVQACVLAEAQSGTKAARERIADCLYWQANPSSLCRGSYQAASILPPLDPETIELKADQVSLNPSGQSELHGHVQVKQLSLLSKISRTDASEIFEIGERKFLTKSILLFILITFDMLNDYIKL